MSWLAVGDLVLTGASPRSKPCSPADFIARVYRSATCRNGPWASGQTANGKRGMAPSTAMPAVIHMTAHPRLPT